MCYSQGHPVRLVGGRLALDFVNTADWSANGEVVHEKLASAADLDLWLSSLRLKDVLPLGEFTDVISYRLDLRQLLLTGVKPSILNATQRINIADDTPASSVSHHQPLVSLLAVSAMAILSDQREQDRLKMCPGENCGWLFLDETKNGRRTWCRMEGCGNRAKAARHYARQRETRA
jgi:hypothetical protein